MGGKGGLKGESQARLCQGCWSRVGRAWWRGLSRAPHPHRPNPKSCTVPTMQFCFQSTVASDTFQQVSHIFSLSFPFSSFLLPSFCISSSFSLFLKVSSSLPPFEFSDYSVEKPAFFTCAKISQGQEQCWCQVESSLQKAELSLWRMTMRGPPQNHKTGLAFPTNTT